MTDNARIYIKKIRDELPQNSKATVQDVAEALYYEGESIMTAAKTLYVPVVTGALRNSGTVKRPEITNNKITVTLAFGNDAAPYAAVVHEYPKRYGQGKSKYLITPTMVAVKNMAQRIARRVARRNA